MTAAFTRQARSFARALLVLVAVTVAMTLLQPAPAEAYSVRTTGNYPGRVTGYQVQGTHYDTCVSNYYTCFTPWVVGSGPVVYRSPRTNRTQKVAAVYELQVWNGSRWVQQSQRVHYRYIRAGYSRVRMPRVDFLPNRGGYFRIRIGVAWSNYYDTVGYGGRLLTYNHAGDYICNTRFPCQRGNGYVWLRSPGV